MRRWRGPAAVPALLALAAAGLAACGGSSGSAQATLQAFDTAWAKHDYATMATLVYQPSPSFMTTAPATTQGLGATASTYTFGTVDHHGSAATAALTSTYQLPGVGAWQVHSTAQLSDHGGHWYVDWSPSMVDPALGTGERLSLSYTWPQRAPILGAGSAPLTVARPQVDVGIEGALIKDRAKLTEVLEQSGASASEVTSALAVANAHPTWFAPVFVITEARFQQLGGHQGELYLVAGTVFEQSSARAALTTNLGDHLVGSVAPVTAQELTQLGPTYDAASMVGQSGLESEYQARLAGTPGATITVEAADGTPATPGGPGPTVATWQPKPGTPVLTSIDPADQKAAESALAPENLPAAMVAVDASTGQVLAAVTDPATGRFDDALAGEYPPGSTFKVVTSAALIQAGLTPASSASCPPTATVDGEVFHNAEGEAPVSSLEAAFSESCNTAFIQLATAHLGMTSLPAAASELGIGQGAQTGLASFSGSVPQPVDEADLAATAIGQGRVLVSPLAMAMVAAAVDSGVVRLPRLVAGAPDDSTAARPLPATVVADLRQMMSTVATGGTAAGTGLPPGTYAKTGTAQYGSGPSLRTDAWLIGYNGGVAFAVVVQGGSGNGGPTDGPLVASFLRAIGNGAVGSAA